MTNNKLGLIDLVTTIVRRKRVLLKCVHMNRRLSLHHTLRVLCMTISERLCQHV